LAAAVARLAAAGCETPRLDAEVLLAFALGCERAALFTREFDVPSRFWELVARRAAREPVAYITGERSFRWLSLNVDRRVLIPRPETELLVEIGLSLPAGARVVDVGTGSGAVALALKDERPDLSVAGVDIDCEAVEVARGNALRLGLDVSFVCGDLLPAGSWGAVLANLPYVADSSELPPEIARYEPPGALYGGPDGLDVVRRLVAAVDDVSLVALEVGAGQAGEVATLLSDRRSVEVRRDLAGIERVVIGRR
jgi:release factor glutamine methyltransferase